MTGAYRTVWFNQGLSNAYDALRIMREADRDGRLRLLASHTNRHAPVLTIADRALIEPDGELSDDDYVAWCLDNCAAHGIALFVPHRRRAAIAERRGRFDAAGTRVLVAGDRPVLDLVETKERFYADLAGTGIPLPEHRVVTTAAEFDEACTVLSARHPRICVKPTVSVFGLGFRILEQGGDEFDRLMTSDGLKIGIAAFRAALAAASRPRPLLVMEYLPGPERSIDCLAHRGRLVAAVARVKRMTHQITETAGPAIDIARQLTERYRLDGVFNVQTRDAPRGGGPVPHLLEVNSRMSGGMLYACLAGGVPLPYWAALLALGLARPEEVPAPRGGVRVAPVQGAVTVGETAGEDAAQPAA